MRVYLAGFQAAPDGGLEYRVFTTTEGAKAWIAEMIFTHWRTTEIVRFIDVASVPMPAGGCAGDTEDGTLVYRIRPMEVGP